MAIALWVQLGAWPGAAESLGGFPLCEASAALVIACPEAGGDSKECLLIGDNEVRDRLFVFPIRGASLDVAARRELALDALLAPTGDGELSDIEALAHRSGAGLLVYGSHSRNKDCKRRGKRRRILELELVNGRASPGPVPLRALDRDADLSELFGARPTGLLREVARTVERAEQDADRGACEQAFNLEAAFHLPGTRDGDQWVGLRRPLLRGHAVLLRQDTSARTLRFAEARLVDLGGEGVRGAATSGEWVYGLSARAGGGARAPFRLWRFPIDALAGTDPIRVEPVAEVPNHSEGIAIVRGHAFVVVDGKETGGRCVTEASYSVVRLP